MPVPIDIRPIPGSSTHALRHRVLWPSVPLEAQAQAYDEIEGTVHLGAFFSSSSPSSSSSDSSPHCEEASAEPCGVLTLVLAPCLCPLPSGTPQLQVQLRKFAVAPELQGRGVGGAMLAAAVNEVRRMREGLGHLDDSSAVATEAPAPALLHLDARREQAGFYERRGLSVLDPEVFVKKGPGGLGPGVEYVRMGRIV